MASVLGLDIGGSSTRGRLVVDGTIAAEASAGSGSLAAAGEALATEDLRSLIGTVRAAYAGVPDAVCAGAAGSGAAPARAWLTRTLTELTGARRVSVVDDVELVLAAAGHREGIAIVCGTGSIAHGRGPAGSGRVGGWGWLLGDEGGGYALVRGALRTVLGRRDRNEPTGALLDALLVAAGSVTPDATPRATPATPAIPASAAEATLDELLVAFYADPRPERWAALAPAVLGCGDPAVAELVAAGARVLAGSVGALAQRVGLQRAPLVLAGGLVAAAPVRTALRAALDGALPGWPVEILGEPPVAGAVALALDQLGAMRETEAGLAAPDRGRGSRLR